MKLEWTKGEWEAPDGKKVPYYEADLMPLFEHIYTPGAMICGLNVRRWPKNTTVKLAVDDSPDGVDEYTGMDGDGDGSISGYSHVTLYTLLKLPTSEFDANPDAAMLKVRDALRELDMNDDNNLDEPYGHDDRFWLDKD